MGLSLLSPLDGDHSTIDVVGGRLWDCHHSRGDEPFFLTILCFRLILILRGDSVAPLSCLCSYLLLLCTAFSDDPSYLPPVVGSGDGQWWCACGVSGVILLLG